MVEAHAVRERFTHYHDEKLHQEEQDTDRQEQLKLGHTIEGYSPPSREEHEQTANKILGEVVCDLRYETHDVTGMASARQKFQFDNL